jgi:hypothetical protein
LTGRDAFAERAAIEDGSRCVGERRASSVPEVPVLSRCQEPSCDVLTIGRYCIQHDSSSLTIAARQRRDRWDRPLEPADDPVEDVEEDRVAAT